MPVPTDSHYLLRSLELLMESIEQRRINTEGTLQEIDLSGVEKVIEEFRNAAVRAGMPASRAHDYAEEYSAAMSRAKSKLDAAIAALADARGALATAAHIARVVPHRCPNADPVGGTKTLVFT